MARYFKPIKTKSPFDYQWMEHDRFLDEECDEADHSQHDWLLLPLEEGQKQYLYCLKCGRHSHL